MTTETPATAGTQDETYEARLRQALDTAERHADAAFAEWHDTDPHPQTEAHRVLTTRAMMAAGRYLGLGTALELLIGDEDDVLYQRQRRTAAGWFPDD